MLLVGILFGFLGTTLLAYQIQVVIFFIIMNALASVLFFPSILVYLSVASSEGDHA